MRRHGVERASHTSQGGSRLLYLRTANLQTNCVPLLPRDTCQIDILFLYTSDARSTIGGITDAQFQSRLADAIADSNISFRNSQIDLEFNLRHVEEVLQQAAVCVPFAYGAGPPFFVFKYHIIIVHGGRLHGLGKSAITCWRWRWKTLAPVTPRRHRTRIYTLLYTGLRLAAAAVRSTPAITRPPAFFALVQCLCTQLPYEENRDDFSDMIATMKGNDEVSNLRDTYGADLVQLLVAGTSETGLG